MLRIRLSRVGKKKQPAYRLVVADSRSPRDGAFLEIIGHYDPLTNPAKLVVKEEQAVHWLQKGAQPSETAAKLLTRIGVMERAGLEPVRYSGKNVTAAPKKEAKAPEPQAATRPPAARADTAEAEASAAVEAGPEEAAALPSESTDESSVGEAQTPESEE